MYCPCICRCKAVIGPFPAVNSRKLSEWRVELPQGGDRLNGGSEEKPSGSHVLSFSKSYLFISSSSSPLSVVKQIKLFSQTWVTHSRVKLIS